MNNIKMLYYDRMKVSHEMGWRKLIKEILTVNENWLNYYPQVFLKRV